MTIIVNMRRIFPPNFLTSARNNNGYLSPSEKLGKIILSFTHRIDENDIRKGDPENNEPDLMFKDNSGIEITFASNRQGNKKSSIAQLKSNYHISGVESEIIQSINDSVEEKAKKKSKGNYRNVNDISIMVITLEPYLFWYGYLHGINNPYVLQSRDEFFQSLYDSYIANSVFKNIYVLQLTEFKTYNLYNVNEFYKDTNDFIVEIGSDKIENLPYCELIDLEMTEDSILDGFPLITYKYNNEFK